MNRDSAVPTWDGQPQGWRRYCREVSWFVQATKVNQRRHIASKLIARLTNSARLLAMSWPQAEFDHDRGVISYLQKLAKSPLVRRLLPNAAATMAQYFSFRKHPHESISSFLVRETLTYEEFQEALIRLREERSGQDVSNQDFGLEALFQREDDAWWKNRWQEPETRDIGTTPKSATQQGSPWRAQFAEQVEEEADEDYPQAADYEALPQRSPQASDPGERPVVSPVRRLAAATPEPLDAGVGMTSSDSFVLDVLRGWRLLQAASLNRDEWRDILSATNNKLDFESISNALQVLWDEQLMQAKNPIPQTHGFLNWHDQEDHGADDSSWWYEDEGWWHDAQWHWDGSDDWSDVRPEEPTPEAKDLSQAELDDPQIREAMQSEKMAESLAAEARLTWQKAQEATAALRKDRGFGAVMSGNGSGKGSSSSGCHICHHPGHFARDCPDRFAPKGKGKPRFRQNYMVQEDPYYDNYYTFKGKGKPRSRYNNLMEFDNMWVSKGKGKHPPPRVGKGSVVNAYGMELYPLEFDFDTKTHEDLFPLEMLPTSLTPESTSPLPPTAQAAPPLEPFEGMVDSGATASAGPQASVERVFQSLRQVDHEAQMHLDPERRPWFRYGSGKWNRALGEVSLKSSMSGVEHVFKVFALPNPPEYHEPWFDDSLLVPILIGMDFLGAQGVGMVIDFTDGYSWAAMTPGSSPQILKRSSKGHFVLDLVEFLTDHPGVALEKSSKKSVQFVNHAEILELHPLFFSLSRFENTSENCVGSSVELRRQFVKMCVDRHRLSAEIPSSSDPVCGESMRTTSTSSPIVNNINDQENDISKSEEFQGIRKCTTGIGSQQEAGHRSSGSTLQKCLAMFQESQRIRERIKQVWSMDPLQRVCSEIGVCPQSGHQGQPVDECGPGVREPSLVDAGEGSREPEASPRVDQEGHREGGSGYGLSGIAPQDQDDKRPGQDQGLLKGEHLVASSGHSTQLGLGERGGQRFHSSAIDECDEPGGDPAIGVPPDGDGESKSGTAVRNPLWLSTRIGKAAMVMLHLMTMSVMGQFQELIVEPTQVSVWEVCCSPNSWLAEACKNENLKCQRINLANGFDFNKPETFERMTALYKIQRPKKIWVSMKCTLWCPWTSINYNTPARREVLEARRRRERQVLRRMVQWLVQNVIPDPSVHVYWEWPVRCVGWHQSMMTELEEAMSYFDRDWLACRIDGCRYGMKSQRAGLEYAFLNKRWRVQTSCTAFHAVFKSKTCVGNHEHVSIEGQDTERTSYYPWRMVVSIAKTWKELLFPTRWVHKLSIAEDDLVTNDQFRFDVLGLEEGDEQLPDEAAESSQGHPSIVPSSSWSREGHGRWKKQSGGPSSSAGVSSKPALPSKKEIDQWETQLLRFHKASGHPSNRNLARILKEAGKPAWQVDQAMQLRCSACESIKPGGSSSGNVPPAATSPLPRAWSTVLMDVGEWSDFSRQVKLKFLLIVDAATRYKAAVPLLSYGFKEQKIENTQQVIEAFSLCWLSVMPKPLVVIPDNALTLTSAAFREFCTANNLWLSPPVEKEAWAHGTAERAMQEVKLVMDKILASDGTLSQNLVLSLAVGALNATDNVQGYSPFQWAFGHSFVWTDEDISTHIQYQNLEPMGEFNRLLSLRRAAEDLARKTKADTVLSKLKNSCPRQPLRSFEPSTLVKVWRKMLPHEAHKGRRGGYVKAAKPHWIGPGRVLFQELLPGQQDQDRKHIVWVVIGGRVHRCSIHSVRPLTEHEKVVHEIQHGREELTWKSLQDIIPRRDYVDLTDQIPTQHDRELADLPEVPDRSTWISPIRLRQKRGPHEVLPVPPPPLTPVNEYEELREVPPFEDVEDIEETGNLGSGLPSRRPSTSTTKPLLGEEPDEFPYSPSIAPAEESEGLREEKPASVKAEDETVEPEVKRARTETGNDLCHELHYLLDSSEYGYVMELDLEFNSNRKMKKFLRSPSAFLVQQLRDTEVRYEKLTPAMKRIFDRAKNKEVSSFVTSEAVRKCTEAEEREGWESGRVMSCRWVLTWKPTPPEDLEVAK